MKPFTKYLLTLGAFIFLIPNVSFASTQTQAQQLNLELSQVQNALKNQTALSSTFSLSLGQSMQRAASTTPSGLLTVTFQRFLHTTPDPMIPTNIPQPISHYAGITLEYDPCVAAAPSVCISKSSPQYPVMTSELQQGQGTSYLHYFITLTSLSSTTATFTITDSALLPSIQNQLNTMASQIKALLGT